MMSNRRLLCWSMVCVCLIGGQATARTVTDALGRTVTVDTPLRQVVVLIPSIAESIVSLGLADRIIGADAVSAAMPALHGAPVVGTHNTVLHERIAALQPDMVFMWPSIATRKAVRVLARLNIPVYFAAPESFAAIAHTIRQLGVLFASSESADRQAAELMDRIRHITDLYADSPERRAFFVLWHMPLITSAGGQWLDDLLSVCGIRNIFADVSVPAPQVSWERVLARRPEILLTVSQTVVRQAVHDRMELFVASGLSPDIYVLDEQLLRPGAAIVDAVASVCARIQGGTAVERSFSMKNSLTR